MLTWRLAERLAGTNVTANAMAPGFVKTELNRSAGGVVGNLIPFFAKLFGSTPAQGADTAVWLAAARELRGTTGKFYEKRKELTCTYRDSKELEKLFRVCERMTAVQASARATVAAA
jgi:NAD(P)-dependent dehydrogenase (short-subunit alcohol dehydrogenase family)